ncbi:MAG: M48 family metallopeptidase [Oligoflexales bacterium]|nr:M48 family metallopeptidase [Oligoflexales bacterium]
MDHLLFLFIFLKVIFWGLEFFLSSLNKSYYSDKQRQESACRVLDIGEAEFAKTFAYTQAKHSYAVFYDTCSQVLLLLFLGLGGLAWVEGLSFSLPSSYGLSTGPILRGLFFFGILGALSSCLSLPFELYSTFKIEEKFGFNRQSLSQFFVDKVKGLFLGVLLGSVLLAAVLYVMESSAYWWLWAWLLMSAFSLLLMWLFPAVLAPLFNKFSPLPEGELKEKILQLSNKIGFRSSGLFVMDASKRSSHGNAYFTGLGAEKRIVLFDTLLESLSNSEIVAVLAHELGHFKLAHVRRNMIRSLVSTGLLFYLMQLCSGEEAFFKAFSLAGLSSYGTLLVFSLWWGVVDFFLGPLTSWLSRRDEFAADAFARQHLGSAHADLGSALIKLQKSNSSMPLMHPLYSSFYASHPPILERLEALK